MHAISHDLSLSQSKCIMKIVQKHERCSIWNQTDIQRQIINVNFNNSDKQEDRISDEKNVSLWKQKKFAWNICCFVETKLSHTSLALECKLNVTDVVDKAPLNYNKHDNLRELFRIKTNSGDAKQTHEQATNINKCGSLFSLRHFFISITFINCEMVFVITRFHLEIGNSKKKFNLQRRNSR